MVWAGPTGRRRPSDVMDAKIDGDQMPKSMEDRPASDAREVIELLGTRPVRSEGKLVGPLSRLSSTWRAWRLACRGQRDRRAASVLFLVPTPDSDSDRSPNLDDVGGFECGGWAACRVWPLAFCRQSTQAGIESIDAKTQSKVAAIVNSGARARRGSDGPLSLPTRATTDVSRRPAFCHSIWWLSPSPSPPVRSIRGRRAPPGPPDSCQGG